MSRTKPVNLDAVNRLSPSCRGLLLVKALMGGLCSGLTFDVINGLVEPPKGQHWTKTAFQATEAILRQLKLLETSGRCPPALEHELACEAIANAPLVDALRLAMLRTSTTSPLALLELDLRLALYAGNEQAFATALRKAATLHDHLAETRSAAPFPFSPQGLLLPATAAAWVASRPLRLRLALLTNHASLLLDNGYLTPLLPAMLPDLERFGEAFKPEETPFPLLMLEVLRGRIDEVRPILDVFMRTPGVPFGYLASGVDAMLRGEPTDALPLLLEARKRWRKFTGKRNALLPSPGGLCLALAQLATGETAQQADLERTVDMVLQSWAMNQHPRGGWHALNALLLWNRGQEAPAREALARALNAPPPDVIDRAMVAVADALISRHEAQARAAVVKAVFASLHGVLPLPCRVLAEFLAFVEPAAQAPQNLLVDLPVTAGWLELFTPRAAWERIFDGVLQTLCPSDAPDKPSPAAERRMVWTLDLEYGSITPLEQKAKGAGWTTGRTVSLKRLSEERAAMPWLTEQDQRIINAITWFHRWHGIACELDFEKALPELVGHPLLVDEGSREPLALLRRDVALTVREETRGGHTIALTRPGREAGRSIHVGPHLLVREEPHLWCLYHTAPKLRELAEHLGPEGLYVPPAGSSRVRRLLRELDPAIPLQAEVQVAAERPGCPRPVVRLRPLRGGVTASLGVRPFDGLTPDWTDSPFFETGKGNPRPMADHLGQMYRVARDFTAEQAAATRLVAACPTLRDADDAGETGPWEIPDLEAALTFLLELRDAAAADPELGPLTEWPEGETLRVEPHATPASLAVQIKHHREWFQMHGQLAVREGLVLDMGRLLERLELAKGRFLPLEDGAFLALTQQFKRQLQRLAALSEGTRDGTRTVHPLGAAAVEAALEGVRSVSVDAAWSGLMERIRAAETHCPHVPATLRADLRDYQTEGFVWLSRLAHWGAGACLADDMGLGKTVQTIAALLEQAPHGPALIVAPTSVCHNWVDELRRFAPTLKAHRLGTGTAPTARLEHITQLAAHDVLIISYGLLHTAAPQLSSRSWRSVVFDEAQALKNAATKRARASKTLNAHFRVALTGTPIENYLEDVWSLFNTINPGLLGTLKSFQQRFASGSSEGRKALRTLLRPFLLRRTKSAVLTELPPRTEQVVQVELPPEERAFYEALRRRALEQLEQQPEAGAGQRKLSILTELTRLRRACCHPALIDPATPLPGAKLAAFLDLVDNLLRGQHKALVFSQFVSHLALVRKALDERHITYQYLDGATPEHERQKRVRDFQDGEGDLFLISLKAGGQGLNLTAADYVIHLDPWWNPAVEDQASDRAHRMGQERPVTVYRLVAAGSVEEKMLALHASKRSLAADVLDGAETPLSEAELLALLREERDD